VHGLCRIRSDVGLCIVWNANELFIVFKTNCLDANVGLHLRSVNSVLLCRLFNSMLRCGRVPNDFHMGIIIPVIKDVNADVSTSNNYRGITLSLTIPKLFELCIMEKFGHLFDSSDLQF
jgi:hypothetical protein